MKVLAFFGCFVLAFSAFAQAPAPAPGPSKVKPAKARPAKSKATPGKSTTTPSSVQTTTPAAEPAGKAILTVGDERVTAEQFEAFIEALPEQYRAQARGPMKRQVAQDLVRVRLLAAEARRRGLDKTKETQSRVAFAVDNLLAGAVYKELLDKSPIDEAAMRKHYEGNKSSWEQSQARHILVRFKGSPAPLRPGQKELSDEEALAKAQDLRKRIGAGEDFAAVAKAESDDTGSGTNGGDLGSFKRGAMVPAFDQAAFSLPVGQMSEPIKTQFGYHIIKVDKREVKPFEVAKPEIENKLRPEMARSALEAMIAKVNVVYDESYFGPDPAKKPAASETPAVTAPPSPPDNKTAAPADNKK